MEKVVIDIEGRFTDNVTSAATGAAGALERLAKKTVFVKFDANASPFLKVLNKAESLANKFGHKKISATLNAVDKATNVLGKVWNFGLKIGGKVWRATVTVIDKATAPIRGIFNLLKNPVFQVGTALGLSFGAANMVSTYKDFEAAMSNVGAISGATGRDMEALTAKAKEMGAATKFTATEASEAMSYMAMAGWKPEAMLSGIEGIMNLAAASGESLASTSDIVTDALTAFKLLPNDSGHFADVLASASANANTNIGLMGETFKYVGTQAGTLGYSIEDVALATGLMANAGLKGSMAGTALSAVWTRLSANTSGATDAIRALGVEFYDGSGNARRWRDVMDELRIATAGMTTEQKTALATTVAGQEAQKGLFAILNASEDDYNKLAGAIDNANGAAARMAKIMMDNLSGSLDLLKSAAEGAILTIMNKFGPHMRTFVDWLAGNMPKIGNTVGDALDFIGTKVTEISGKIKEITGGADWKFGSIGDKIKLLWDGLVADPLSEWWNNGGREKATETAGNIGKDLGEILKTGLLAIFGMTDALNGSGGEAMSAGASIAKSFVEGFSEGFDFSLVADKLKESLGNIWNAMPGWAKTLTGGIIGSKVVGGLSQAVLGGMAFYKNAAKVIGSANAGTGLLGMGANAAIMLGAGNLAGGASFSAGALSALGLGSVVGGLISGVGLISAYNDFKNARNATNETDRQANNARGSGKVLGFGAGAAIGAAIGAHFLGIGAIPGALIGGGIGTWIGRMGGDNAAKNIESAKFATEEMKAAIQDTNMSAEELAQTFQKAVYTDMKSRFGDIELSLGEIQRLSDQIVWGDKQGAYNNFVSAQQAAAASMQSFQEASGETSKWMWKASLGVEFDESEKESIMASFDEYISSAKDYVSNKHEEFTAAVSLLFDVDGGEGLSILQSGNTYYAGLQEQLNSLGKQLSDSVEISLGDGVISVDEQAAINDLQRQIADIMQKVSDAEFDAQLGLIKLKFGNGNLSLESLDSFISQLDTSIQSRLETGEQAYVKVAAAAKLQYDAGLINFDEYQRQLTEAADAFNISIDELSVKVESIVLDIIGDAYPEVGKDQLKSALEQSLKAGIDPIDWTDEQTAQFLNTDSLASETADGIRQSLSAVAGLLGKFGLKITPDIRVQTDSSLSDKLQTSLDGIDQALEVDANVQARWTIMNVGDEENQILALVSPDKEYVVPISILADENWTIGGDTPNPELLSPDGEIRVPISADAEVHWENITGQTLDTSKVVPETADPIEQTQPVKTNLIPAEDGVDTSAITYQITSDTEATPLTMQQKVQPEYVLAEDATPDLSSITSQIPTETEPVTIKIPIIPNIVAAEGSSLDSSTITSQIPQTTEPVTVNVPITATYNTNKFPGQQVADFGVQPQYDFTTVVVIVPSYIVSPKFTGSRSIFGVQSSYSIGTTVSINVSYSVNKGAVPNLAAGIPKARGGLIGPNGPMGFATGGMVRGGPQLVTVAEEGAPEMIIPLGSHRRQRGIELWERAGRMLGIPGLANGGIAGNADNTEQGSELFGQRFIQKPEPLNFPEQDSESSSTSSGETTITVNVGGVTLQFNINGSDDDAIASAIEARKEEIANSVGEIMKKAILEVFVNTPAQGGRTT